MTKKMHGWSLAALPLAIGMATFSGAANAVAFNIGEVEAQLDSQLSVGVSVSTQNPDKRFIHKDTLIDGVNVGGEAASRTSDDGRLNYGSGDAFSKIFRGVHDLELRYGDSGAFFRGKYWYDFETKDGGQSFYDIDDSGRSPLTKASGVALLDAFVYHNYFIGNNPGNVRLGRQVVSWGESTFIQNSINAINPLDVAALRRPGAELKEGLLPVEMLYISQGLTENLSMEAFYQLKWHPYVLDNCGTFFGGDTQATGCVDRLVFTGSDSPQGDAGLSNRLVVRAKKDQKARDDGQFGVALRWFVPELNDSEFGFYAMNYHSRTPNYSNIQGRFSPAPDDNGVGLGGLSGSAGYFFEFPEDIRLYGVSFQTMVGGASVAGELSYRPNMPMQITTGSMSVTGLRGDGGLIGRDVVYGKGDYIQGYDRKGFYQAQVTVIQFIERVLGASRLSLAGEIGYNHIEGIDLSDGSTFYGRDSLFGTNPDAAGSCLTTSRNWCESDGFYTSNSWGYRARASLDYANVIAGINLSPNLTWSHDVEGYGPNFSENAKAISVGLNADYGNKYNASISYTNFFDGKYNTAVDRDFAAVSFSVSF